MNDLLHRLRTKHPWHVRAWLWLTRPYRNWKQDRDAKRKRREMKRVGYFVFRQKYLNDERVVYTVWEAQENGLNQRKLVKLSGGAVAPPAAVAAWARGDDSAAVFLQPMPYWNGKGEIVNV